MRKDTGDNIPMDFSGTSMLQDSIKMDLRQALFISEALRPARHYAPVEVPH